MSTNPRATLRLLIPAALLTVLAVGCEDDSRPDKAPAKHQTTPAATPEKGTSGKPAAASWTTGKLDPSPLADSRKVEVGKNVYLESQDQGKRRRVLVNAYVCLREGPLEQLMCRRHTKEHEAILAADCDARTIHAALILARAKPGSVVKYFENKPPEPPTGTPIKVTLQYKKDGKTVVVPARDWVRNGKTRKALDTDWVFAGSQLLPNDDNPKQPYYAANSGDVICVSNFADAMLDVPINSPKDWSERFFEAYTKRIPPLETPVLVILEPRPDAKAR